MGDWRIDIRGVGPHGSGTSADAETIAREAVARLRAAGHSVSEATIHHGGPREAFERHDDLTQAA